MSYLPDWEMVIGLEVHAQLKTNSKLFSAAPVEFGALPNTHTNAVDLALPGALPVLNRAAVSCAIRFGLSVGGDIAKVMEFDRKHYFYPDLPKGYQISQMDRPAVSGGNISIALADGSQRTVRLNRAHLEEDAGKSLHEDFAGRSGIDLNRAGVPLLEIVSEPDLRSAEEAGAYLRKLHAIVLWIGICDGRMAEGSMRCDANLSLRPFGREEYGERCEIKNLNSFRFVERALLAEARRQAVLLESGQTIKRQTMLYDEQTDTTRAMRSKESSEDYRYFPDPDLLPVQVPQQWIDAERDSMPELPEPRAERLQREHSLSAYDAAVLTADRATADYYEKVVAICGDAKLSANWVMGDLSALLNEQVLEIGQSPVNADSLGQLLLRIADGTISGKIAKTVLASIWQGEGEADDIIAKSGLQRISDSGELEQIVGEVLANNAEQVEQYRAGKTKVLGFLVGQVMKASQGRADPPEVNRILREKLDS